MDDIAFLGTAIPYMAQLVDFLEKNYPQLDIEDDEESIIIELSEKRQFLVNIHSTSKQIWLSSPLSGAHHFAYDTTSQDWIDTRGTESLLSRLDWELEQVIGIGD